MSRSTKRVCCLSAASLAAVSAIICVLLFSSGTAVPSPSRSSTKAHRIFFSSTDIELPLLEQWYPRRFQVDQAAHERELAEKGNDASVPVIPGSYNPYSFQLDVDQWMNVLATLPELGVDYGDCVRTDAVVSVTISGSGASTLVADGNGPDGKHGVICLQCRRGSTEQYYVTDSTTRSPVVGLGAEVTSNRLAVRVKVPAVAPEGYHPGLAVIESDQGWTVTPCCVPN